MRRHREAHSISILDVIRWCFIRRYACKVVTDTLRIYAAVPARRRRARIRPRDAISSWRFIGSRFVVPDVISAFKGHTFPICLR